MKSIRNVLAGSLLAGGALLVGAAGFSIAGAPDDATAVMPPHGFHHGGFGPGRMFSKLGLTEEQQASVKAIMTAAKPQMKGMHDQMRANHAKLMQITPEDPNYGNVVAEVAQSNATLAAQRTTQAAELRTRMYALLTPAQKTQLATLEAQHATQEAQHGDQR